jgi:hypothetical protein
MNKLIKCFKHDEWILTQDIKPNVGESIFYDYGHELLKGEVTEFPDDYKTNLDAIKAYYIKRGEYHYKSEQTMVYTIVVHVRDIGYVSESVNVPNSYITHKIRKISEEELELLNTEEFFYVETEELRNKALTWDKPINSYTFTEPLYSDHLRWIDNKLVVHFKNHSPIIRYSEI